MIDGPISVDESSKSNPSLTSGRRLVLVIFVAVAVLVCLTFVLVFWLAIFFADHPTSWILGLVVVGGLLGVAQATILWSFLVDLCVWSIDTQRMRRVRLQFPVIDSVICAAPRFARPVRGVIMFQSVVQILGACIIAFFIDA